MNRAGLVQRFRRWRLARQGLRLHRSCLVESSVSLGPAPIAGTVEVGKECQLGRGVELNPWGGRIRIGRHVFIGPYTVVYGQGGVEIGDHTLVAMHCSIVSAEHVRAPRAAIIRNEPDELRPTRIGRDVWLGAGVRVLGGVSIGDGCIVGAGAVVTSDLPPYTISVGVPARVVGQRP